MKRIALSLLATLSIGAAPQALAQTPPSPVAQAETIDPALLAAGRRVAVRLFPIGSYKRLLGESYSKMMGSLTDSLSQVPVADLARVGGLTDEQARELGETRLGEAMAIYDPHWKQRMQLGMDAMTAAMTDMFSDIEPRMQEGLARAYARNFTLEQLNELEAFFRTPTGTRYADKSLEIYMDPEVMKVMGEVMPDIMKRMPELMTKVQEASASLPPPRKIKDLNDEERRKLAGLLGVKASKLDDAREAAE